MHYIYEYTSTQGTLGFLNAPQNYSVLIGVQTNLYKCFLPKAWEIGNEKCVSAFVHPDGVFDDSNGGALRKEIYKRFVFHFHFINEKLLFSEVGHPEVFSLNVYSNKGSEFLTMIGNLFDPKTIDECFDSKCMHPLMGIKDNDGNWNLYGNKDRVIKISEEERKIFSKLYDDSDNAAEARLPIIHAYQLVDVLRKMSLKTSLQSISSEYYTTQCFDETGAQDKKIITVNPGFVGNRLGFVYNGPHIGVANPVAQTARAEVKTKGDFDRVDITEIPEDYLQRTKYNIATDEETFKSEIPMTPWGTNYVDVYKLLSRKMLNLKQERTLITAIAPPGTAHINGIFGIAFSDLKKMVLMSAYMVSVPYDYFIKSMGKTNLLDNNAGQLPFFESPYSNALICRALLLNCVTNRYAELWSNTFNESFIKDCWAKKDSKLQDDAFSKLSETWEYSTPLRTDYERRMALVEIDVLTAMALGMTCEELKLMYTIQFPVLKAYEDDTWYDSNGRIVFTNNRSLTGVGLSRSEFDEIKNQTMGVYSQTITDDILPSGINEKTIEYCAPYVRCNREKDYEDIWSGFADRFS